MRIATVFPLVRARTCALVRAATFLLAFGNAQASSLQVLPVGLILKPTQSAASITMINSGEEAVTVQGELFGWHVENGQSRFNPTEDVFFNPPVFTIAPGKSQTIRIGVPVPNDSATERSYRLFLQEVPSADPITGAVKIAIRFSIPIYLAPSAPEQLDLKLSARPSPNNPKALVLNLSNTGNTHIAIRYLRLIDKETGHKLAEQEQYIALTAAGNAEFTLIAREALPPTRLKVEAESTRGQKFEGRILH